MPKINTEYSCEESGHILEDRYRSTDRTTVRKLCVIPGCHFKDEKDVRKA